MKYIKSFLNDSDGLSAKDFIMILFSSLFAVFLVTAFVISLVGTLNPATLTIIQSMDGVIITIVGGVFGLQGIREFRKAPTQSTGYSDQYTYTVNDQTTANESLEQPMRLP